MATLAQGVMIKVKVATCRIARLGLQTPVCSRGWPRLGLQTPVYSRGWGLQTPVCSRGWGSKRLGILKHLYVALVGDPDAWAYPKHLCVAPFGDPNTRAYSNTCV